MKRSLESYSFAKMAIILLGVVYMYESFFSFFTFGTLHFTEYLGFYNDGNAFISSWPLLFYPFFPPKWILKQLSRS